MAIFSRFPIVSTSTNPYSLCGHPADLSGDWFVGKAAVSAVLRHPVLDEIEVFNTHVRCIPSHDKILVLKVVFI